MNFNYHRLVITFLHIMNLKIIVKRLTYARQGISLNRIIDVNILLVLFLVRCYILNI